MVKLPPGTDGRERCMECDMLVKKRDRGVSCYYCKLRRAYILPFASNQFIRLCEHEPKADRWTARNQIPS